MTVRFYSFKIVTYNTLEVVEAFCSSCKHYAYALHDKEDTDPHFHVLATFSSNKSFEAVKKLMGGNQNTFVQPMTDKFNDFLYLTHENAPEKYQYSKDIVITNSREFFIASESKTITNEEFVFDICFSTKSLIELAVKYGRDYIKNFRKYSDFAKSTQKQSRDLENGYDERLDLMTYDHFLLDMYSLYISPFFEKLGIENCTPLEKRIYLNPKDN